MQVGLSEWYNPVTMAVFWLQQKSPQNSRLSAFWNTLLTVNIITAQQAQTTKCKNLE
jgi:hypothetical protein